MAVEHTPNALPVVAVSMGDPGGIGPEVLVRALAEPDIRKAARFRVFGAASAMERAADLCGIEPDWWRVDRDSDLRSTTVSHPVVVIDSGGEGPFEHRACKRGGELSFRFVEDAIAEAKRADDDPLRADAICTGPISKHAWSLAGRGKYPGHTELLATRFGAKRVGMFFESPKLRVILATAHIPLMELRNALTIGKVFDAIDLGYEACKRFGIENPRIAVCGLNPHAGEEGLLGDEESRLIEPAIKVAQDHAIQARGPFPGDTVFGRAVQGEFDLVVAMYHDQGLIPVKLLGWEHAVNVTVGLPVIRTSPDHGTAFDIAGKGKADPSSMIAALRLAAKAARSPHPAGA
ncbi:MAG: 4-hydroxythreonine-4-phosphate dehydrogenase PdxA [Phycisphaerales bacterium]|nr:MAG: 4-hydroxythreonine-4-phosphate dehydrogenase PdxA [Phycisphaerales bacterium]